MSRRLPSTFRYKIHYSLKRMITVHAKGDLNHGPITLNVTFFTYIASLNWWSCSWTQIKRNLSGAYVTYCHMVFDRCVRSEVKSTLKGRELSQAKTVLCPQIAFHLEGLDFTSLRLLLLTKWRRAADIYRHSAVLHGTSYVLCTLQCLFFCGYIYCNHIWKLVEGFVASESLMLLRSQLTSCHRKFLLTESQCMSTGVLFHAHTVIHPSNTHDEWMPKKTRSRGLELRLITKSCLVVQDQYEILVVQLAGQSLHYSVNQSRRCTSHTWRQTEMMAFYEWTYITEKKRKKQNKTKNKSHKYIRYQVARTSSADVSTNHELRTLRKYGY